MNLNVSSNRQNQDKKEELALQLLLNIQLYTANYEIIKIRNY
jgi:hypothetical protein